MATQVSRRERRGVKREPGFSRSPGSFSDPVRKLGTNTTAVRHATCRDSFLARERPGAVLLPAGNAFDFPSIGAEHERVDDGAADAAFGVAEGRYRFDLADQLALRAAPHERRAVAKLRKLKLERSQRHDDGAAGAFALAGNRGLSLGLVSFEMRGGGRKRHKYKSARPNYDRSVASERTHNQLVPHSDAGITHMPRAPYQRRPSCLIRVSKSLKRAPPCTNVLILNKVCMWSFIFVNARLPLYIVQS